MPDWIIPREGTRRIGVLLFERFSNHCLANAVEPLRAANTFLDRPAYAWKLLTLDGQPVTSSSGLTVVPEASLAEGGGGEVLMVMPSYDYRDIATPACGRALRAAARRFGTLAGLDTGSWLLAEAGLLAGRRATIHYEVFDAFAERFPEVQAVRERWVADGDRISAGGAMTAFELVLHLIGLEHGAALTLRIAALFMHPDSAAAVAGGAVRRDRHVARALAEMERNVETPLPLPAVARRAGCRLRDLEARFLRALGATPATVYRRIRLNAARGLVLDETMSVAEIATRTGYADPSAFTRAFRREFGETPRALRR